MDQLARVPERVRPTSISVTIPERFALWWSAPKDSARPWRALSLTLLAICAAVFAVGVPYIRYFGQDVFIALDGGWRVLNGQRPTADFLATMGPLWYLLYAGGLAAAGKSAVGLAWTNTFVAAAVAVWACLLLRRRMAPRPYFLACVAIVLLVAAPSPLGYAPWHSTFAMSYNRQGFALMGLILLECFLPEGEYGVAAPLFWGAFSTGLGCAILVFVKISYGLVAIAVAGFSILARRDRGQRLIGLAAGFLAAALPILAYLRFDIGAILRESRLLASVRGGEVRPKNIVREVLNDRYELAPALLLGLLTILLEGLRARRRIMLAAACVLAAGAGTALILGNAQPSGLPLMAVAALLLANELTLAVRSGRVAPAQGGLLLSFALLAALMPAAVDAAGMGIALADKAVHPKAGARIDDAPQLRGVAWFNDSADVLERNENGERIVRLTEEGMALARANSRPDESIRGLVGMNQFSYALLRPPSHGGAVSITDRKVSEKVVPPLDILIGDVDLILAPKFETTDTPTLEIMLRRYPDLLGGAYRRVAESPNWTLYRRAPR